ncbi:hypothetical protein [Flavobacterium filum]|uniref:hypothetical protein n=1 Tax=Flavobacterium filum TaxID=370974 RepID=UPI0023F0D42B|nr:hypothetical protein [Flavobacterium filum]
MEVTTVVKVSDLTNIMEQLSLLRSDIKQLKESEDELKALSIQQTATLLNLHYNSVRKLVLKGKLLGKYLDGDSGKCIIPLWSIKLYLKDNNQEELLTLKK